MLKYFNNKLITTIEETFKRRSIKILVDLIRENTDILDNELISMTIF